MTTITAPESCPTAYIAAVIARIKATKQHDAKTVDTECVRDVLASAPFLPPCQGMGGGWKAKFYDERTNSRFVALVRPDGTINFCADASRMDSEKYINIASF